MSILDFIKRQIKRYRDLLANLSRRNKELFYRESRAHCINLSKAPKVDEGFDELIAEKFTPLKVGSSLLWHNFIPLALASTVFGLVQIIPFVQVF